MGREERNDGVIVSAEWLLGHLDSSDVVIIDCRYSLSDFSQGRRLYSVSHIKGAYFMDLEDDLSGQKVEHGGRHPLPDPEIFARKLSSMGVSADTRVIAYDSEGSASCRLCWLLKYFGHEKVSILQGGFERWVLSGLPVTDETPPPRQGNFVPVVRKDLIVDRNEILNSGNNMTLIDCRAPERYSGEVEPLDRRAGHIPGAKNLFYREVFSENSTFKDLGDLEKVLADLDSETVLYCGSGVTATVVCVAMGLIGKTPRIYTGSWSDWASYVDSPITTGDSSK